MNHHVVFPIDIKHGTLLIDIATRNVMCLAEDSSVSEAARGMAERRISSIVVTDASGHPAGIVTERNILRAMRAGCPQDEKLRTIMSSPLLTVPASIGMLDAYQFSLRNGIRHLVVVDEEGMLAGVVSETDFRLHMNLTALAGHRSIASAMSRSVIGLPPQASLRDALELMQSHRDSCVVVVEDERPAGIVTERDIVQLYAGMQEPVPVPLREIMTSPVLTVHVDDSLNAAAKCMLEAKVRHIVVVDGQGRLAGLIGEHDLTQAMALGLIDDELVAEGSFLRTLVNTIPDLIWLKNTDGVYLACNARFEQFFGALEQDIVGKTDYDFADSQLADSFREHDRMAMAAGKPSINEEWLTFAADGYRGLFETIKTPMRDGNGRLVGVLGIARDISERKRAEAALRASEEKLRGLYELSPMGIALTDMQGRYIEFNDAFRDICGYTRDELNKLDYWALTPREYADQEAAQLESLNTRGYYGPYEKEYIRKDGRRIPLRLNGVLIQGGDGQPYIWSIVEDITGRKQAEAVLAASEFRYRTLVENSPFCIHEIDLEGRLQSMNQAGLCMLGLADEEKIRGEPYMSAVSAQDSARIAALMQDAFNGQPSHFEFTGAGDAPLHFKSCFIPIRDAAGKVARLMGITEDITERKRSEDTLRVTASVFDTTQEAILITDAANAIIDVNPAFTRITGYHREEVLGHNPKLLSSGRQDRAFYTAMWKTLAEKKSWRGEIWNRRKNGETYAELLSISVICDGNGKVQRHVGVFSDISHLKAHEAELSRVAHYDALTGIPNRVLLADRLKQAFAQTLREQDMLAVCYLDLDGFKPINDALGHEAGDEVLVEVAKRIERTIRGGDTVARLGGDEFVVALLGLERGEECVATLERLLAAIDQPIIVRGHSLSVSASIGVSIYPLDDEDPDTLLRHADQAMYVAKQAGKNRFHIYDPALDLRARNQREFLQGIRHGLKHGEFELYYQPKIDLRSRQLVGAEALIRWHHPERGLLPPSEFLRLIENTELDIELGDWVIASALRQLERWRSKGLDIEVSINISAHHLESARFTEKLRQQLAHHAAVPPDRLQIEVLETAALNDIAIVRGIIESCRSIGVGFALDDFGTGYSSLSYLGSLPVDVLKIDQTFVRDMLEDKGDMAIVQGIIALAHAFERKTVAEGIENDAHYQALLDLGCEIGQGYGIARPMPADELLHWAPERTSAAKDSP